MRLLGIVEIRLITKKRQILNVLKSEGKIRAVKKCRELHGWSLSQSLQYVNKLMYEYEDTL